MLSGNNDGIHAGSGLTAAAISAQAARLAASSAFRKSKRLTRFLTYAVDRTLEGQEGMLKESILGREVFDRGGDFDPRIDPIVRIDARRLRSRVAEYYETDGARDPIKIRFEAGSYVPVFEPLTGLDAGPRGDATGGSVRGPRLIRRLAGLDLLRQGQRQLETFTPEGVLKSRTLFERAAATNPDQPLAHLGVGMASMWMSILLCESSHTAMARVRAAAERVLALDSAHAEGHALLGVVQALYDFDPKAANDAFLLALRLDPRSVRIRHARALFYLAPLGLFPQAIAEIRQLAREDALPVRHIFALGWMQYLSRDYEAAAQTLEEALAVNPRYLQARYALGVVHEALGQHTRADEILLDDAVCSAYPLLPLRQAALRHLRAGDLARARAGVVQMESQYSPGTTDPVTIAAVFTALADHDRALQWLERAYEDRRYWLIFLKADPVFDPLRSHPALADLLARMGLASAGKEPGVS